MVMRMIACAAVLLALVSTAVAAPQDTTPAQETAEAFVKAIVAKDFAAFKGLCASKLQAEYARNAKNCRITRWWTAVQEELTKKNATWVFKSVKSNLPKNVTLAFTRTMNGRATIVHIGVIKEGDKWLVDSAGSL